MFTKYFNLAVALATFVVGQDTTSSNPRIVVDTDTVTNVYTPVATSTNIIVDTTSLPHSLDTITNVVSSVIVSTSLSTNVITTNTLDNGPVATESVAQAGGNMLKAGSGILGAAILGAAALV